MSLHLSNISSCVRKDELERVFRKFGHCNVNLKDGYGFAVYDVPVHAEKAMRVLHGNKICGEPISLSWSKQQPKSSYSVSRNNRLFELQHDRKFKMTNEYFNKKLDFKGCRDYKYNFKQGNYGGNTNFEKVDDTVIKLDEDNIKETAGEDRGKLIEDYSNEDCKIQNEKMDNNRWETGIEVSSSKINDESEFHRYDPLVDVDDKNDVDEYLSKRYSGSSPAWRRYQEKIGREFRDGARENLGILSPHKGFCICGEPEHRMHSCSRGKGSVRKRLSRFDDMPDKDFRGDMNGLGTRSQESLKSTTDVSTRRPKIENRFSSSIKQLRLVRSVNSRAQEIYRDHNTDHVERKRTRRENGNLDKRDAKKSTYCDHNVSRSFSKGNFSRSASKSDSYSRSRSLSRKTHSGNNKSRARTSSPASSSLSVSLDRPLPSSTDKTQMNQDDNLDAQVQVNFCLHNSNSKEKNTENISVGESVEEKDNAQEDHILQDRINVSSIKNSSELRDANIPLSGFNTKSFQEDYSGSYSTNPLRISLEELGIVLKHYGLNVPTEDEKDLPVDAYFGSARLWPWQIIYYRKLKKGFISTENYARRIVQNQEFGIVDKYIRSSSGWEELGEENFEL